MFSTKDEQIEIHVASKKPSLDGVLVSVTVCTSEQCYMLIVSVSTSEHEKLNSKLSDEEIAEKTIQFLTKKLGLGNVETQVDVGKVHLKYGKEFESLFQ